MDGLPAEENSELRRLRSGAVRTVSATTTGRPARRCARCRRNRSDGSSAHCASSTARTSGPRSVRLATSQYRPCRVAKATSRVSSLAATSVNTGSASRAAPARSRSRSTTSALTNAGSRSCRTMPKPKAPLELAAARQPHRHSRGFGTPAKLVQQRGLADPGRAFDQQHPARPRDRLFEGVTQRGQVVLAVQKAVGGLVARRKDCGRLFGRQLCREPPSRCIISPRAPLWVSCGHFRCGDAGGWLTVRSTGKVPVMTQRNHRRRRLAGLLCA